LYTFQHTVESGEASETGKDAENKNKEDKEPESPFKVVKRRESNKEPVTALASDDLDKHAYPNTPVDTGQTIADTNVSEFARSSSEDQSNIERIGSSSSHISEKQMQRPSSSASVSSKAQEVMLNSETESTEKLDNAYGNELFDNKFVEEDDVVIGVLEQEVQIFQKLICMPS
jgi:hypothetical protein